MGISGGSVQRLEGGRRRELGLRRRRQDRPRRLERVRQGRDRGAGQAGERQQLQSLHGSEGWKKSSCSIEILVHIVRVLCETFLHPIMFLP